MNTFEALKQAYAILSPYSDSQRWEFESNLFHLNFILNRISKDHTVIDVGCGIGIFALTLKLLGFDIDGVDKYVFEGSNSYRVDDIEHLKNIWKSQNLSISAGDAAGAHSERTYDVVVSIAVIEHQSNLKSFMEGLKTYTKPEGYMYIATPNAANFLNRFRMLFGRAPMGNIDEFFNASPAFTGHWREYTVDELKVIARLAGLSAIEVGNAQTVKPHFTKNWRKWHVNVARLGAQVVPRTGETNYIWAKK